MINIGGIDHLSFMSACGLLLVHMPGLTRHTPCTHTYTCPCTHMHTPLNTPRHTLLFSHMCTPLYTHMHTISLQLPT